MNNLSPSARAALLDSGIAGMHTSWADQIRCGEDEWHDARLLAPEIAAELAEAGLAIMHKGGPANPPEHLRGHVMTTLTVAGLKERERLSAVDDPGPDELTLATGLGVGSPLLHMLTEIRDLISTCAAELVAVRCSMMAAAKISGEGERFADMLEAMLQLDAEERGK